LGACEQGLGIWQHVAQGVVLVEPEKPFQWVNNAVLEHVKPESPAVLVFMSGITESLSPFVGQIASQ